MKKLEKIIIAALVAAMVGIVIFWVAGFNDKMQLAAGGFLTAGVSAWVAIIAIAVKRLRYRNLC